MRLGLTALAVLSACAALYGQARADEVYDFATTTATNTNPESDGRTLPVTLNFDLSDAVVEQGSFTFSAPYVESNFGATGDVNGFNYLTFVTGTPTGNDYDSATITPAKGGGSGTTSLTFDSSGNVTSTSINELFFFNEVHLSGTGNMASGYGASDANVCFGGNLGNTCSVTGVWTRVGGDPLPSPVPEPASLALLGAGVIGLGLARRRRASLPA